MLLFRNFYVRRTLRIFPLYYGVLVVLFGLFPRLREVYPPGLAHSADHQAWLWSYTTNVYLALEKTWALPFVSHFWSLAVEEHFYLVWPCCVYLLPIDSLAVLCVACSVVALTTRIVLTVSGAGSIAVLVATPCRLDALCIGALLAVAQRRWGKERLVTSGRWALAPLTLLTLGLSCWNLLHGPFADIVLEFRGTALALFFGALIATMVGAAPLQALLVGSSLLDGCVPSGSTAMAYTSSTESSPMRCSMRTSTRR